MKREKFKKDVKTEEVKPSGEVSTQAAQPSMDAPVEKFSTTREVQPVSEGLAKTMDQPYVPKVERRKSVIKQEAAAVVASGRDGGGGVLPTGSIGGTNHGSYSGNEGTIAGGLSGTPITGEPTRSASRFGKKLDTPVKKIDSTVSEQVILGFEESKPLSESRDSVQGYNGTYRNQTMRLQKNQGAVPGSIRFVRSVDEIQRDQTYFTAGQVVKQAELIGGNLVARDYGDTPTLIRDEAGADVNWNSTTTSGVTTSTSIRGNYVPMALNVKLVKTAGVVKVQDFNFSVDDITALEVDSTIVNSAASHALTHVNRVELTRQVIDSKAGDEQLENWSPLARAVRQPTQTLSLLKDYEQDTGAVIAAAYRKLSNGLAYQINKSFKDGIDSRSPVAEMINSPIMGQSTWSTFWNNDSVGQELGFTGGAGKLYNLGSAALFLELFDSTGKYNSKGDFLMQPRSFKMHLNNAKGSLGIFRTNPDLLKAMSNMEVFSTIGHEYDPTKPVCMSDYLTLVSPVNWNTSYNITDGVESQPFTLDYADVRNDYETEVYHPLLKGIQSFIALNASRLFDNLEKSGAGNSEAILQLPIRYATTGITGWELLVLASIQQIERVRIDSMRELLDYERAHGYPFEDLVKLDESTILASKNFTFTSIDEPLKVGNMKSATALTWRLPELYHSFDEVSGSGVPFFHINPWYMNEGQFESTDGAGGVRFEPTNAVMSWPSSRDGLRLGLLDDVYSMDERTARLALDRIVRPLQTTYAGTDFAVYKYDMTSDGIPVTKESVITIGDFLKLPREVGYFLVSPFGYSSPVPFKYLIPRGSNSYNTNFSPLGDLASAGNSVVDVLLAAADLYRDATTQFNGESSYRIRQYVGKGYLESTDNAGVLSTRVHFPQTATDDIATATTIASNRGLNFVQDSVFFFAAKGHYGLEVLPEENYDLGLLFSLSDLFIQEAVVNGGRKEFQANKSLFAPFFKVTGQPVQTKLAISEQWSMVSFQKYFWTRLNVLPFAINPFDTGRELYDTALAQENTHDFDPYDFLYMFNLAGFRASDFEEDLYNKLNKIDTEKLLYTVDHFASASPILE